MLRAGMSQPCSSVTPGEARQVLTEFINYYFGPVPPPPADQEFYVDEY